MHCRAFAEERAQALGTSLQELTGGAASSSGGFSKTDEEARRRWRDQRDQQEKEEGISIANGADLPFQQGTTVLLERLMHCCASLVPHECNGFQFAFKAISNASDVDVRARRARSGGKWGACLACIRRDFLLRFW